MAINYFDLFKLLASTGVGIYGASQQKKNNANNAGIASGIADNFKIPNFSYNREQVEERDDTNRRAGSKGRRYFTDANYTDEAGNVIDGLMSGDQNGIGGGNQITQEQAESQGVNPLDIAKGVAAGFIIPKLASAAYTGIKAGLASGSVAAGTKAALSQLGIGGASGITNASANVANFLPANPIGAIPTAVFDMAAGGANAASGIAGVNAASQTAANLGGNIAAFGADKVAPAINYGGLSGTSGGLTSNLPAGFGSANATAGTTAAANAAASANVATGGLGTGGGTGMLSGLGALPTASQLAYLSPYFAAVPAFGMAAKYLLKPAIRGLTNFGSEEDAKREEAAKYSKESGLDDYKAMAAASMGREGATYEDYIKDQRPPDSPFKAEMDAIGDAGDRDYEEEQVVNMFQTPYGKNLMAKYYADNPKFFTPEGKRIFPESDMGDLQRASAAYNEQPIFGRDMRTGENPMSEYITNVMNKDDYGRIAGKRRFYNAGGIVGNNPNPNGYFLDGPTDGMADKVPANIGGEQPAALSDGEFVIPADIVSHLGNGSSMAGANKLDSLMQSVRMARTGNEDQGKKINANKYLNKLV